MIDIIGNIWENSAFRRVLFVTASGRNPKKNRWRCFGTQLTME